MTPSIKRMIKLLTPQEQVGLEKEDVIALEEKVLTRLQFDFNYPSSLTFLERFLRLAEHHKHPGIVSISEDLLKVAATQSAFLDYRPSRIAAAVLVMAVSLCELKKHPAGVTQVLRLKSTKQLPGFLETGITFWTESLAAEARIQPSEFIEPLILLAEAAQTSPLFNHHISAE